MELTQRNIRSTHRPTRFGAIGWIRPSRLFYLSVELPVRKASYIWFEPYSISILTSRWSSVPEPPDTTEIAAEMEAAVKEASADRPGAIWIPEMLDKQSVIEFYSHAAVFCCPSIYEPFGIINLEAMACETAVVASAVGGIPEVVEDGETGILVPVQQMPESPFTPLSPKKFERDLAAAVNRLMVDKGLRERFATAGRQRAERFFSWAAIAKETHALYKQLVSSH